MASSDSSSDKSDEEFWEDLDTRKPQPPKQLVIQTPKRVEEPVASPTSSRFAHLLSPKVEAASEYDKENTSQRLENIALSKEQEASSTSIILKSQARKQVGHNMQQMSREYKKTVEGLQEEIRELKSNLLKKDRFLNFLNELETSVGAAIADPKLGILNPKKAKVREFEPDTSAFNAKEAEAEELKRKIKATLGLCEQHKATTLEFKTQAQLELQETRKIEEEFERESEEVQEHARETEQSLRNEIWKLEAESEENRKTVEQQIEEIDQQQEANKVIIANLQEELRTIKHVLHNDRNNSTVLPSLSEYAKRVGRPPRPSNNASTHRSVQPAFSANRSGPINDLNLSEDLSLLSRAKQMATPEVESRPSESGGKRRVIHTVYSASR